MTRPLLITVIGKAARDPKDPVPPQAIAAAEEVGRLLAEWGAVVVSGGSPA
jgi:predicted Rossmann-fold nucleotide-binding protein